MGDGKGVPPKLYTQKLDMCASLIVPMMGQAPLASCQLGFTPHAILA